MEQTARDELDTIVAKDTWTAEDHTEMLKHLFVMRDAPGRSRKILAQLEAETPEVKGAAALKVGIARYMLCRFTEALDALSAATDNKDRCYFRAMCHKELRQYDQASEEFRRFVDREGDEIKASVELIECQALGGDLEGADGELKRMTKKIGQTADWFYLRGLIDELSGGSEQAGEAYEKAHEIDSSHSRATFRLAYHYDLHGDEVQAIGLYKECIQRPPVHSNALLNLAVLYEDAGQYDDAAICLKRILTTNPNHQRARLFLRDAQASRTMYYDEDQARRIAKRNAILDIPVTDFELSVRARNCLKKMNIRTLGDLVNTTEPELLSYKNFGETSLKEIKDMLNAKNLRLGQALEEGSDLAILEPRPDPPQEEADQGVLGTPIDRVEFSVRARRALQSLKIKTLGDLVIKTETDLMGCRNFGQTSLNEIRQRLAEFGLKLRESG
jgi:DNA-directed RNA polymerase subunit alpha